MIRNVDTRAVRIPVHPDKPVQLRPLVDFRDPRQTLPQPRRPMPRAPVVRAVRPMPRWLYVEAMGEC